MHACWRSVSFIILYKYCITYKSFALGQNHYFNSRYNKYLIYCCSFNRTQRETITIGNNAGHILIWNKTAKSNGTVVLIIVALLSNGRNLLVWVELGRPPLRPTPRHTLPHTSGITCPTLSLYVPVNYFSKDVFAKSIITKIFSKISSLGTSYISLKVLHCFK